VADLSARPGAGEGETRTRGQIILVTAFALALVFLGLAIVVNSAIFTENLATRSENVDSSQALNYRHGVTQNVGDIITEANENDTAADHDDIAENVSSELGNASEFTGVQQIEDGNAVTLERVETRNGTRIFQENASDFTSNESDVDWTLAEDVDRTRAFTINVTDANATGVLNLDDFTVVVNDTTNTDDDWTMSVDEDEVTVERASGETETCSAGGLLGVGSFGTPFVIDVTGATVAGEPCPALVDTDTGTPMQFGAGVDNEYNLSFENADDINGTYSLVVYDGDIAGPVADDYAAVDGPEDGPFNVPAMYGTTLTMSYETTQLTYETNVTVAPGEPGDPP